MNIGKTKALYATQFTHRGHEFWIHRPVSPLGLSTSDGWMLSIDGIPLQLMKHDLKPKAIKDFTTRLDACDLSDTELASLIDLTKLTNKQEWSLP